MFKFKKYILFFLILIFNFNVVNATPLVNKDWLKDKICNDNIKVIEVHRSKKDYELAHIPCSIFTNFYSRWLERN